MIANLSLPAVLMDKGIVLGTESEVAIRSSMPFVQFRFVTSVRSPVGRCDEILIPTADTFVFTTYASSLP
jgi:hypothetical protein